MNETIRSTRRAKEGMPEYEAYEEDPDESSQRGEKPEESQAERDTFDKERSEETTKALMYDDEDDTISAETEKAEIRAMQKTARAFFSAIRRRTHGRIRALYRRLNDSDFVIEAFEKVMKGASIQKGVTRDSTVRFARSLVFGRERLAPLPETTIAAILGQIRDRTELTRQRRSFDLLVQEAFPEVSAATYSVYVTKGAVATEENATNEQDASPDSEPTQFNLLGDLTFQTHISQRDALALLMKLSKNSSRIILYAASRKELIPKAKSFMIGEAKHRRSLFDFALLEAHAALSKPELILTMLNAHECLWALYVLCIFEEDKIEKERLRRIVKAYERQPRQAQETTKQRTFAAARPSESADRRAEERPSLDIGGGFKFHEAMNPEKAARLLIELGRISPTAIAEWARVNGNLGTQAENIFIGKGTDAISLRQFAIAEANAALKRGVGMRKTPNYDGIVAWAIHVLALFGNADDKRNPKVQWVLNSARH